MAERLLILTLALETALKEDNFADAQALFDERGAIIDQMDRGAPTHVATMLRVIKINKQIETEMIERGRQVAIELRKGARGKLAHKAYRSSHGLAQSPDSLF